ncbi:hypothetical protein SAMN04515671_0212 [Nakamurella panacisegetis]|uniref:Uncharacterized protein n=1 Tax=Nakamurella panacisegetis TaxID=1090615 RepID=A0A1H0HTU3_9ACTN|nr:hypothetical protein SAMN04515671_0212 [Nakamurella panacisegetis]
MTPLEPLIVWQSFEHPAAPRTLPATIADTTSILRTLIASPHLAGQEYARRRHDERLVHKVAPVPVLLARSGRADGYRQLPAGHNVPQEDPVGFADVDVDAVLTLRRSP